MCRNSQPPGIRRSISRHSTPPPMPVSLFSSCERSPRIPSLVGDNSIITCGYLLLTWPGVFFFCATDRILFRDQPNQNSWLWEHIVDRSSPMEFGYEARKRHPLWDEIDYFRSDRSTGGGGSHQSTHLKTQWLADSSLAPQQLSLDGDWFAS